MRNVLTAAAGVLRAQAISAVLRGRFEARNALIQTSSPRSGSTLLGQALSAIPESCVLFEPLHLDNVPQARAAGFSWRTYVDPTSPWSSGRAFLQRTFEGRVVNRWTAGEMSLTEAFRARHLIVKFVRANRLLPWICQNFAVPPPVLLLRHPCAVVASQLKFGWANPVRPDVPAYLSAYPDCQEALARTASDVEYLAALWALDQLPPMLHKGATPWIVVTYEELVLRPRETLEKIFSGWGVSVDPELALARLRRPSSVVHQTGISGISGWRKELSQGQITRILETVRGFGLSFYGDADEPDYDVLGGHRYGGRL